jgi:hypothetical protein
MVIPACADWLFKTKCNKNTLMANTNSFRYKQAYEATKEGRDLPEPTHGRIAQILCGGDDNTEKRGIENHRAGTIAGAERRAYDKAKKK